MLFAKNGKLQPPGGRQQADVLEGGCTLVFPKPNRWPDCRTARLPLGDPGGCGAAHVPLRFRKWLWPPWPPSAASTTPRDPERWAALGTVSGCRADDPRILPGRGGLQGQGARLGDPVPRPARAPTRRLAQQRRGASLPLLHSWPCLDVGLPRTQHCPVTCRVHSSAVAPADVTFLRELFPALCSGGPGYTEG